MLSRTFSLNDFLYAALLLGKRNTQMPSNCSPALARTACALARKVSALGKSNTNDSPARIIRPSSKTDEPTAGQQAILLARLWASTRNGGWWLVVVLGSTIKTRNNSLPTTDHHFQTKHRWCISFVRTNITKRLCLLPYVAPRSSNISRMSKP